MSRIGPGTSAPLGATWDGEGTNFALFSAHATAVELCLFDHPGDPVESTRIPLLGQTGDVWHAYLPDVRPGRLYGYRVHGPWAPSEGHRFNPARLLLDPYAKAITGTVHWDDPAPGLPLGTPEAEGDLSADPRDSAPGMPRCVVIEPAFSWGDDRHPRTPWSRTVVYECHVKGMTMRHPDVPPELRGTYLGLATDPVIDHLRSLGVTAVELLPIHHAVTERRLAALGLVNYWGYSPIGYFAPDARFATGADAREADAGRQVAEFKTMVKRLHRAELEVILDVVYNHTAEGNHGGPTLGFRGIENAAYYRLDPKEPRRYADFTGCGNTLDIRHPRVLQLVMDSLRFWVGEMHVDGFRFDLAPVLARDDTTPSAAAQFFEVLRQDPVLADTKLVAEPWDLGPDGYQLGRFPVGWAEWNGRYRDGVRRFWRGDAGALRELALRLTGSSDLFASGHRGPQSGVNFVTCHDGFTLQDLVSYEAKHNQANGEENRDGTAHNLSRNWGVEGPTDEPRVLRMRERIRRSLMATLALSQGVPMLAHGDELGRTLAGNNNAYCHDGPLTWLDWDLGPSQRQFLEFACGVFALRAALPVLRQVGFLHAGPSAPGQPQDLVWLRPDGTEMTAKDWEDPASHVLGMLILTQPAILLLVNGGGRSKPFTLPVVGRPGGWSTVLDTAHDGPRPAPAERASLAAHSLLLLRHDAPAERARTHPRP